MKKSLVIWLFVELLVAIAAGQVVHVERHATARAWTELHRNPKTEHQQDLNRQLRIAEMERWGFSGILFAVLAGATLLVNRLKTTDAPDSRVSGRQSNRADANRTSTVDDSCC